MYIHYYAHSYWNYILWTLFTRMDIILSTEKLILPSFWVVVGPKPLEFPSMHWCESWHNAERRDFTADIFIKAELSKSFQTKNNTKLDQLACKFWKEKCKKVKWMLSQKLKSDFLSQFWTWKGIQEKESSHKENILKGTCKITWLAHE